MKKLYLLTIAFTALFTATFAQNDPHAKKILDGVSNKFRNYQTISANFSVKSFTSKGKSNGTKTGNILIKGQKYFLKEGKNEIVNDGVKIYNYDGNKTITVSSVDESSQTLTPQKILSGTYDKDFTFRLVSTKGNFHEIDMKPIDDRKNFKKVTVLVDKGKNMITRATILDKSNNTIQVGFSNLVANKKIADNLFSFNRSKYPRDAEVLD